MNVDYDLLRTFVSAAQAASFAEAARQRGVTQSAVSHQLRTLECQLGVGLFERVGRRNQLTATGKQLLASVAADLQHMDLAIAQLQAQHAQVPTLVRIGARGEFCRRWLRPRLPVLLEQVAGLHLFIDTRAVHDMQAALLEGEVDLAFVFGALGHPRLEAVRIYEEQIIALAAPRYIERHWPITSLAALRQLDFIGCRVALLLPWWRAVFGPTSKVPPLRCDLGDMQEMLELAARGLGITVAPTFMLRDQLEVGELCQLRFAELEAAQGAACRKPVWLAWRRDLAATPAVAQVREVLLSGDFGDTWRARE
ncbi:MAG: LysR family transcriptional regulator [Polyangiales bacterium]